MASVVDVLLRRDAIMRAFGDERSVKGFERLQEIVAAAPDDIEVVHVVANGAQSSANTANSTANAIKAAPIVTMSATAALSGETVLDAALIATVLGYTPANKAGETFGGLVTAPNITTPGVLDAGSLKLPATGLAATATASDHSIPIDIGGVTYYLRLSTAP